MISERVRGMYIWMCASLARRESKRREIEVFFFFYGKERQDSLRIHRLFVFLIRSKVGPPRQD